MSWELLNLARDPSLLIKGVTETVENEVKGQKRKFSEDF